MLAAYSNLRSHLEKLHAFCVIAQMGSLSHASKELHSSQAALSHSIKVLEGALSVELFHRNPRGVTLTESGLLLFQFAKKVLLDIDSVEVQLRNPGELNRGRIKVGTLEVMAVHRWPEFLSQFSKGFPEVKISLTSGRVDELVTGLRNRDYHVIVSTEPMAQADLTVIPLYETNLRLYGPVNMLQELRDPVLMRDVLTVEEANRVPVFTDNQAHQEQLTPISKLLTSMGLRAQQPIELNSFEAALHMASRGMGLAILPEKNVQEAVASKKIRPVSIQGIPDDLGKYKLCASFLTENASQNLIQILIESLKVSPLSK